MYVVQSEDYDVCSPVRGLRCK